MKRLKRLLSKRNNGGFTLVEVIISTALLGILVLGVTMFMSPLFGIMQDNKADVRANNLGTTLNYYISRSIRNACYLAVYENAKYDDFTGTAPDNVSTMAGKTSESYRLKCISIRRVQDYKGNYKYMLFNEKVMSGGLLSSDNSTAAISDRKVFEDCYYDGLYPLIEFEKPKKLEKQEGTNPDGSKKISYVESTATGGEEYADSIKIKVTIRDKDTYPDYTDTNDVIFVGEGYSEIRNVKMSKADAGLGLGYEMYATTDNGTGSDIYIFYVERILK